MRQVTGCCVCKKIYSRLLKEWIQSDHSQYEQISATYCPDCYRIEARKFGISKEKIEEHLKNNKYT